VRKILAVNIGNSRISAGLFLGGKLLEKRSFPVGSILPKAGILRNKKAELAIICSVVPKTTTRVRKLLGIKCVELKTSDIPMKSLYRDKKALGIDRLFGAFFAKLKYGAPVITIDFGTATTFNVVNSRGEFSGGMILPGIKLWAEYLYGRTAKLPLVKLKNPGRIIGRDTRECINSGIFNGNIQMVKGLINIIKKETGKNTKVVATGGFAVEISKHIKEIDRVDEHLVLYGMGVFGGMLR
jgi:type III pantothenate kinase